MDKTKTNGSRVKEAKRLMHISISLVDLWPIGWDVCKFHLKCSFIFKSQGQWNAASILKLDLKSLVLILTWSKRDAKKSISSFAFVCGESMTRHVTFFSNLWEFLSGWFGLELFPLIMHVLRFSLGPLCCCFTKRCLSWVASDFVLDL